MILIDNGVYRIEKEGNKISKISISEDHEGTEFEAEVINITNNTLECNINHIRDNRKNKTYKSKRFTKKYSNWVASMIWEGYREAGLL